MINIIKIKPRGYCCGVSNALFIAKRTAKLFKNRNIYMLGHIIHNEFAVKSLLKDNIKLIDDHNLSRSKQVSKILNGSVVILSAHGSSKKTIDLLKGKNCEIVDTTCVYVRQTHDYIANWVDKNYKILFIGVRNHPESKAILENFQKNISLIESIEDVVKLKISLDEKIFVTNQTTLSYLECGDIFKLIQNKYKNAIIQNEICNATRVRQQAIIDLNKDDIDLLIIVGDNKSNNSKKLLEIGKKKGISSYLVSNYKHINHDWITNDVKNIAVTSGASTPFELTLAVEEYLKKITI